MDHPPRYARSPGVVFDVRATRAAAGASRTHDAGLFAFESELEADLTYIPMAVRFKLDKCGIKLSLDDWQLLAKHRRRELLHAPCEDAPAVADFRRALCSFVKEAAGCEPPRIATAEHPAWADDDVPEQVVRATAATGLAAPSPARWRMLTALQRFALVKLSREGRDHRNLGPALREFGLL